MTNCLVDLNWGTPDSPLPALYTILVGSGKGICQPGLGGVIVNARWSHWFHQWHTYGIKDGRATRPPDPASMLVGAPGTHPSQGRSGRSAGKYWSDLIDPIVSAGQVAPLSNGPASAVETNGQSFVFAFLGQ